MKTPRKPRRPPAPVALRHAGGSLASGSEPFVRVATLAPRDRVVGRASTYEERVGALVRRAALPDGMNVDELDRIWERLSRRQRAGATLRGVSVGRWALAAAVLTLSGGTVAAGTGVWEWPRTFVRQLIDGPSRPSRAPRPPAAAGSEPLGRRRIKVAGRAPLGPSSPPIPGPPAGAPADTSDATEAPSPPAPSPTLMRRTGSAPRVLEGTRPLSPPAPSPGSGLSADDAMLSEEGRLLGQALVQLRQAHDPARALVELDGYAARFPSGILGREARIARVDALLMAGRSEEARTVLSRLALGTDARDRELRLIRAELTAATACAAALEDYRAVWAAHPAGPLGERALWGLAACHARLGDEAEARAELARYLARFPDGAHALAARARLRN